VITPVIRCGDFSFDEGQGVFEIAKAHVGQGDGGFAGSEPQSAAGVKQAGQANCRPRYAIPRTRVGVAQSEIDISVLTEAIMGLLEELAGAVVAVEGVKKLDPEASVLTEGITAVTGFEGVEAVTEHLEKKEDGSEAQPT
jgi:hypothetical protein